MAERGLFASRAPADGSLYTFASAVEVVVGGERVELSAAKYRGRSSNSSARILLLHGNPANLDDWSVLASLLGEAHEIVAVDLPGFGKSKPILRQTGKCRLDAIARCIVALADALDWHDPFFVVGHSHGGAIAQVMAARYPDRIEGVVLIATLGSPAHKAYRQLAFPGMAAGLVIIAELLRYRWFIPLFRERLPKIMRPIYQPALPSSELTDQRLRDFVERPDILVSMADAARGSPSGQLLRDADKIYASVLFLHGAIDHVVPVAYAKTLLAAMKNASDGASFEVISEAGHMLHITHALEVNQRITDWTRRVRDAHPRD